MHLVLSVNMLHQDFKPFILLIEKSYLADVFNIFQKIGKSFKTNLQAKIVIPDLTSARVFEMFSLEIFKIFHTVFLRAIYLFLYGDC